LTHSDYLINLIEKIYSSSITQTADYQVVSVHPNE